jgi:hypothetical protein
MTFEEYKAFWLEKPEHYKSTDTEILDWYENGIIIYWASNIKTKELIEISSGRRSKSFSSDELRENGSIYRKMLLYKKEQDKLRKMKADF